MGSEVIIESRTKKITLYHPAYLPMTGSMVANGVQAVFSINHRNITRRWLHYGGIPSNLCGYPVLKGSTLKSITVLTKNNATGTIHIRKDGDSLDLHTIDLDNENVKTETDLNIFRM